MELFFSKVKIGSGNAFYNNCSERLSIADEEMKRDVENYLSKHKGDIDIEVLYDPKTKNIHVVHFEAIVTNPSTLESKKEEMLYKDSSLEKKDVNTDALYSIFPQHWYERLGIHAMQCAKQYWNESSYRIFKILLVIFLIVFFVLHPVFAAVLLVLSGLLGVNIFLKTIELDKIELLQKIKKMKNLGRLLEDR